MSGENEAIIKRLDLITRLLGYIVKELNEDQERTYSFNMGSVNEAYNELHDFWRHANIDPDCAE